MSKLPVFDRVCDIKLGKSPTLEAWVYHFLTQNNLEHLLNPSIVASDEQLRFMVALQDDQVYVPCSDALFFQFYNNTSHAQLEKEYIKCWKFIVKFASEYSPSRSDYRRIITLCRYRFAAYLKTHMILPARLVKRLVVTVLTQCNSHDPFREKKRQMNAKAASVLESTSFQHSLHSNPLHDDAWKNLNITDLRWELDATEISRLIRLSTKESLWQGSASPLEIEAEASAIDDIRAQVKTLLYAEHGDTKKILFLPDISGGIVFDFALIDALLRIGHQVILAVKDGFYFRSPTIWDIEDDPTLKQHLDQAYVLEDDTVSKNILLQLLREHRFLIISDGTTEQLNMYRTSVSFARAWKECDLVIAKGKRNKEALLECSHEFTRDVLCYWRDDHDNFFLQTKARAKWVFKFSEKDILAKAKDIIKEMSAAKDAGKTVMFYSAVIGSIPGQTKVAINLVNTFVHYLRDKLENTFIINPAEHFEEGMDGDDLMYMWEHVQRSGLLDIWRFQTVEDIETSFAILERKVPSIWSGKDSTYSTGCTKEMMIALSVQKLHPELQIIGPSSDKFFRRKEYGVGKYFDATIKK